MKDKIMNAMQRFSKAMFIPVLILPIVGILIAFGNILTNTKLAEYAPFLKNSVIFGFGKILSGSLVPILSNLGIIFCVGLAVGLAKEKKAESGFTSVLVYLIFNNAMNIFLSLSGKLVNPDNLRGSGQAIVLGTQVLDMGVFLGIILGIVVSYFHNKYCRKEFNGAFQIYGGSRLVFLILIPVVVVLAVILSYVWPSVQWGISSLGYYIQKSGNFGVFMYGMLERLLIPTGLHHLVYTPFLYSQLGGIETIGGKAIEGARNIYFAQIADPSIKVLSSTVIWDARGLSKMFGLVGACLALYHTADADKKKKARAILIPAAVTSIIAGVTEPIEFSFLFTAPILFGVHAVLSGLGMVALNILNVRAIAPNGFIDFLLYNLPLGIEKTGWPMFILVGVVQFAVYYVIFRFLIVKLNLKTTGREDSNEEVKLYTKQDYKDKVTGGQGSGDKESTSGNEALVIIEALGGKENIKKVDNCFTRLRLILDDTSKVDEATLKGTGATGVVKKGENVQVIYGLHVTRIRSIVDEALGIVGE
ncbi:PTS transporter subunit EIIC [Clostridium beijerinckii]|uniref:PTS system maltose and glucose-specific IIC component n=1 Tax=Clostridium beijerinckii TaxID=1520 RepID=A0AAX0BAN9_CLOBE|nr:PTS transporter subunit EIIC [Clostridium beijerinckii]NRT92278.1 PTS system maltose and glucose-specific IIC component [Clostridium beijerinckii]NYC75579.1 PTS system maltose and glucose-specific IIC component [Clostridium beijerinckii]